MVKIDEAYMMRHMAVLLLCFLFLSCSRLDDSFLLRMKTHQTMRLIIVETRRGGGLYLTVLLRS